MHRMNCLMLRAKHTLLILSLVLSICVLWGDVAIASVELPCKYSDSINITGGDHHDNGSIVFESTEFRQEHYATINYIMENGENKTVETYDRGCICNLKKCIRLCCAIVSSVDDDEGFCNRDKPKTIDEINQEVQSHEINSRDEFVFGYVVDAFNESMQKGLFYAEDSYQIDDEGQVLHEDKTYSRQHYCLIQEGDELAVLLYEDVIDTQNEDKYLFLSGAMLLSVPFLLATVLVYLCIPQLMNLIGKCIVFYLTSLLCFFIVLSYVQLKTAVFEREIEQNLCTFFGYFIYFSSRLTFAWSNVISFELYSSFRATMKKRMPAKKRLWVYALYTFGLSAAMSALCPIIDSIEKIPDEFKPNIGERTCFLKIEKYNVIIFYCLPTLIMFSANVAFFTSSALTIHNVQKELRKTIPKEEKFQRQTSLINKKNKLMLFVRLLVVMGVFWILETATFIRDTTGIKTFVDVCNGLQGVFVFVLFVLKPSVLVLIKNRWQNLFNGQAVTGEATMETSNTSFYKKNTIKMNQIKNDA